MPTSPVWVDEPGRSDPSEAAVDGRREPVLGRQPLGQQVELPRGQRGGVDLGGGHRRNVPRRSPTADQVLGGLGQLLDAGEGGLHARAVLAEPAVEDLRLLVRHGVDGRVDPAAAGAHPHRLRQPGAAVVDRLERERPPGRPRRRHRRPRRPTSRSGSWTTIVDVVSHEPMAAWWLRPTNRAPTAASSAPPSQSAPWNSLLNRAGRLMSRTSAHTRRAGRRCRWTPRWSARRRSGARGARRRSWPPRYAPGTWLGSLAVPAAGSQWRPCASHHHPRHRARRRAVRRRRRAPRGRLGVGPRGVGRRRPDPAGVPGGPHRAHRPGVGHRAARRPHAGQPGDDGDVAPAALGRALPARASAPAVRR